MEEKVTNTIFQRVLSERQVPSEGQKRNGVASLNNSLELKDQPLMPRTAPVMVTLQLFLNEHFHYNECMSFQVEHLSHEFHSMRAMNESAEYEDCQYEQGSPCTSEGLHMPNSQSLINFTRKVRTHARMRYNSVCTPYPVLSAGTSPIEGPSFMMMSSKMRRISSCPNMKRLDEKDEHKKQVQDNKVIVV